MVIPAKMDALTTIKDAVAVAAAAPVYCGYLSFFAAAAAAEDADATPTAAAVVIAAA